LMVTSCFFSGPSVDVFGQKSDVPVLERDGTQKVRIAHPGLVANWLLQIPEEVCTMDAFYLVWEPISVECKHY
jgi:hypothetical protein